MQLLFFLLGLVEEKRAELKELFLNLFEFLLRVVLVDYFLFVLLVDVLADVEAEGLVGVSGEHLLEDLEFVESGSLGEGLLAGFEVEVGDVVDEATS